MEIIKITINNADKVANRKSDKELRQEIMKKINLEPAWIDISYSFVNHRKEISVETEQESLAEELFKIVKKHCGKGFDTKWN